MQIRDAQTTAEPYEFIKTRRKPYSYDCDLHRHGEESAALEHEHPLGVGAHRHGAPMQPVRIVARNEVA